MESAPVFPKQQLNRSFVVAASILGTIAVAQIAALAVVFATNARHAIARSRENATATEGVAAAKIANAVPEPVVLRAKPLAPPEISVPQTNPTPVPQGRIKASNKIMITELVNHANALREKGDLPAALTKLREALAIAPDEAQIIAEMALTYEKLAQEDKAIEYWRRVHALGEAAGLFFHMADDKLKRGVGITEKILPAIPVHPEEKNRGLFGEESTVPGLSEVDAGTSGGPQERAVSLADVSSFEELPGDAIKRVRLRATVQGKPGVVEQKKVQIEVLFYDLLDGQHVVQTAAELSHQWITGPADWAEDGVEILEVGYILRKMEEVRNYHGYEVRLYYDSELQDVRAEPTRLLNLYPAPATISSEAPIE